jgi:hypothetical protein
MLGKLDDGVSKWKRKVDPDKGLLLLALLAGAYATWEVLNYLGQPLLDAHSFRQTQTALTSYWFMKEGFRLAYQTPVGGAPWTIPYEFPIYQAVVTGLSGATGLELGAAGRLASFLFLCATLFPVRATVKKLGSRSGMGEPPRL